MKTSIMMVTYRKDIDFARFAFAAITKFATGFHEVVVVVPEVDVALFKVAAEPHGFRVVGFDERAGCGMLHHMVKILEADLICPGADAILHLDADCIFKVAVTPDDYFDGARPIIYRQRYEDFKSCDSRYSWKKCVLDATGIDPEWETMCRHPSVYLCEVYALTRRMIQDHVLKDWREYILGCRNAYPQTFAEFPTLGAVAIKVYEERYAWVDIVPAGATGWRLVPEQPPEKMLCCWSHGGTEMVNDRHPGQTARQAIEEILGA